MPPANRLLPLLLLSLLLPTPVLAQAPSYEQLRAEALSRRDAGAPAEAAALLTEGLARWPEDVELRLLRAQANLRAGALPAARADYQAVLATSPELSVALVGLGDVASAEGDDEAASAAYERALVATPGQPDALVGLGFLRLAEGDSAAARDHFTGALRSAPEHPGAKEGLRRLGPATSLTLLGYAGGQTSASTGPGSSSISLVTVLSADGQLDDRAAAGVTWRRIAAVTGSSSASALQELHGRLAWDFGRLRAGLYGARLLAPELGTTQGPMGAVKLRSTVRSAGMVGAGLTLQGPLVLSGATTVTRFDDDLDVLQLEAGASHLLTSWLRVAGNLRGQSEGSDLWASAGLELAAGSDRSFVALSGRYGNELRPVELATSSLYSQDAVREYVLGARASTHLADPLILTISWDGESYLSSNPFGGETTSFVHRAGLALSFQF